MLSMDDITTISLYLSTNYNCHLLCIVFAFQSQQNFNSWKIQLQNENLTCIVVNSNDRRYITHKTSLNQIFNYMNVKEDILLTYNDITI